MKTGVLLINLGTPDAPRVPEVRRYLREFLSDPLVIDIHPAARWALLNLAILPFRPRLTAKAYASIWTDDGSPLLVHGLRLRDALRTLFREQQVEVALGMRYGTPSIGAALRELKNQECKCVLAVPLFPQYASSTTGSAIQAVQREVERDSSPLKVRFAPPFHNRPEYIRACTDTAIPLLEEGQDHILFSFHGLPERHLRKGDTSLHGCLEREDCCENLLASNSKCYRAQCVSTANLLASELGLAAENWSIAFQSRLGRADWIRPYTSEQVRKLAAQGVGRLLVLCPSFVADCLETLEEIGKSAADAFQAAGGERLTLAPSLNDQPTWVEGLFDILNQQMNEV